MSHATSIQVRASVAGVHVVDLPATFPKIARLWRELRNRAFDEYRPELHYMRGPGPKWRERHSRFETNSG
jgi:hypothetical protein